MYPAWGYSHRKIYVSIGATSEALPLSDWMGGWTIFHLELLPFLAGY